MTPSEHKKAVKQFNLALNAIRAKISFKQIKTIGQALNSLGIQSVPALYHTEAPITHALFNELIKPYETQIIKEGQINEGRTGTQEDTQGVGDLVRTEVCDTSGTARVAFHGVHSTPSERSEWEREVDKLLPPRNPKQTCELYRFQERCTKEIYEAVVRKHYNGALLRGDVGNGKTFVFGQLNRWLIDSNWFEGKTFSPFKILIVTKSSIVEQTTRDMEEHFGLEYAKDFWCVNYDALRSKWGESLIDIKTTMVEGEPVETIKWKPFIHPTIFILDEYHSLKNPDSQQHKICLAITEIEDPNVFVLCSSATPSSRVTGFKVFACSTRRNVELLKGLPTKLTSENWHHYSSIVSAPASPDEFDKASVKRFCKEFKPYIFTFKDVHRSYKSTNDILFLEFANDKQRARYMAAYENYLAQKAKWEGREEGNSDFMILVEFLKFRQAAEDVKAEIVPQILYNSFAEGHSVIMAWCFKPSIAKCCNILYQDFNVPRSEISLVWGGDAKFSGTQEEVDATDIQQMLSAIGNGEDVDLRKMKKLVTQLQLQAAGLGSLPPELELGVQTKERRQYEIDRFQSDKSHFCFFTFQAGGAGLSLHHYIKGHRQRRTFVSATYNEMEMEQAFGRGHRINSISHTRQSIFVYRGTIEERVLARMASKKTCLDVVMADNFHDEEAAKILSVTAKEDERLNEKDYGDIEND